MNFLIEPKEWISAEYGSDEIRLISANIKISIGTCIATQVIDELSKSTRDSVRLSAEFLMPIELLEARIDGDYSDDSIEEAARYFMVSPLAVRSHLANHDLIPFDAVHC